MRRSREIDHLLDDDQVSLDVSLESFDQERLLESPSFHSVYRTEESEAESDRSSAPWSPPAWRKGTSGWQQRHSLAPPGTSRSRTGSPRYSSYGDGDDTLLPANVPLPASPEKDTPEPTRESVETGSIRRTTNQGTASQRQTREPSVKSEFNSPLKTFGDNREDSMAREESVPPAQAKNCRTNTHV
jgi:hypothetical protein